MKTHISSPALLLAAFFVAGTALAAPYPRLDPTAPLERIAFGSCLDEEKPAPRWATVLDQNPQLFMMLGVWDDHDYGLNDGGVENPIKVDAKNIFADFFDVPADDAMRTREGIYRSAIYGPAGRRVQIILLDTRWFRSPLKETDERNAPGKQRFVPDDDPAKTMLGEAQWLWLEAQLRQPAELRLIVSSVQVIAEGHGWEGWQTMPLELSQLTRLIKETKANGVIFLSGDRHRAAAYRRIDGTPYPFYELTSSSLNSGVNSRQPEIDPQRLGGRLYAGENFGMVQIDWELGVVSLDILSLPTGRRVRGVTLALAELQP